MKAARQHNQTFTQARRPALLGEFVVAFGLLVVYDQLRGLAPIRRVVAIQRGLHILGAEGAFGFEARLNDWMAAQRMLSLLAVGYYQFLHVGAAVVVLGWCYRYRPDLYRVGRNALVIVNVVGLVAFAVYPVAPPRLLPNSAFLDLVAIAGFGSSHGPIPMNAYAAMPSLHLAWAVCIGLTATAAAGRLRWKILFGLHPLITAVVVVGTGNHYLADVAFGTMLGFTAILAAWALATQRQQRRHAPDEPVATARRPSPARAG